MRVFKQRERLMTESILAAHSGMAFAIGMGNPVAADPRLLHCPQVVQAGRFAIAKMARLAAGRPGRPPFAKSARPGAASSSCSYAAVAIARRRCSARGANFHPPGWALRKWPSTNLVVRKLAIIMLVFSGLAVQRWPSFHRARRLWLRCWSFLFSAVSQPGSSRGRREEQGR